jgi:hydrogenase expression/formation protein HypC
MCLGIPGEIVAIDELKENEILRQGMVSFGGVRKSVCLMYVPEAQVGDYVIVHAGFALSRLEPAEAQELLGMLDQIGIAEAGHEIPG